MIRHSMDVVKKAVEILNPGQVPVIAMDQPLPNKFSGTGIQVMEKISSL